MIFIVVKFRTRPEWSDRWPELVQGYTAATRAEPGNLWFEWSRSLEDPTEYVLVEAFRDGAAEAHVGSDHFRQAIEEMPQALAETPRILNTSIEGEAWARMSELQVDGDDPAQRSATS